MTAQRVRRGFTLVELVITIGVIVFLVGLTLTAGASLYERSEIRQTQIVLQLLDTATEEWELAADRKLTRGVTEGVDDVWQFRAFTLVISEVLDQIRRTPAARDALGRIDPDFIHAYVAGPPPEWILMDYTGQGGALAQLQGFIDRRSITILDAWGVPIYATHPGKLSSIAGAGDPDGTINTYNEQYFGAARNRRICYVSAGPDRRFGNLHFEKSPDQLTEQDRADIRDAADNLYSYPVLVR